MILVLMDFDGTITKKDTFIEFIKYHQSSFNFYTGFLILSPIIIAYKTGIISNRKAKEFVFSYFFKGLDESELKESGDKFAKQILPRLIRKKALDEIEAHKKQKAKIVVVTASFSIWIRAWCINHNIYLIATNHEVINEKITGNIKGENCYGIEKTRRIKEIFDLDKADKIFAYGDSKGDKEMLNIADEKYFKWKR